MANANSPNWSQHAYGLSRDVTLESFLMQSAATDRAVLANARLLFVLSTSDPFFTWDRFRAFIREHRGQQGSFSTLTEHS